MMATARESVAAVASEDTDDANADVAALRLRVTNEYGAWGGADFYPWKFIVEPHRTSVMTIANPRDEFEYAWSLEHKEGTGVGVEAAISNQTTSVDGTQLSAVFTRAGATYSIVLSERARASSETSRSLTEHVKCKYVRRELRRLTESDLEEYLKATAAVHRLSLAEGQRLYGSKFKNYEYFTAKHLDRRSLLECTPYHKGDVFLTAHAAFNLEFEQALQSINPLLSSPYWVRLSAESAASPHGTQSPCHRLLRVVAMSQCVSRRAQPHAIDRLARSQSTNDPPSLVHAMLC